jgi:GABA(A) receptor-associated protein
MADAIVTAAATALPYRRRVPLAERKRACERARMRHPAHVPTILERSGADTPVMNREKFLLSGALTGSQLQYVVRRRLALRGDEAIFLLCDRRVVPATASVFELDARHRDPDDGFLYVVYTCENAFGG